MFELLDLKDDDFDDFVIPEDDEELQASTRWLAVARVVCSKKFSHEAFFQQMNYAWNSAQGIKIRAIGENRFIIQCFCLGDWEKVTEKGPWLFREWAVAIAPYDGFSDAHEVDLNIMPIWLQVHKLPEGYHQEPVVKKLVGRVAGKVEEVEMNPGGSFRGDFVRVRVNHDVRLPLTRFVSISHVGKRYLYAVKYEKLGQVCYACGIIGHGSKECGLGIYDEKELKFGDWIYVTPPSRGKGFSNYRGTTRGGRTDGPMGHGQSNLGDYPLGRDGRGGRGRGSFVDWRLHPERKDEDELEDTGSSPIKKPDIEMTDPEANARKRLAFPYDDLAVGGLNSKLLAITNGSDMNVDTCSVNDVSVFEGKEKTNKRSKKLDGQDGSDFNSGSAASLEDDRRQQ
jgi:hypothetical protein